MMMNIEIFTGLLFAISVSTSLFTEAIKLVLDHLNLKYPSNIIACIASVVTGMCVCIWHNANTGLEANTINIMIYVALVAFGWLTSMLGYDKVTQAVTQIFKAMGK